MHDKIYTNTLHAGSRSYFFDLKKALTGDLYLEITESKKKGDGSFERHNIMIFQEDIKRFKDEIVDICQ